MHSIVYVGLCRDGDTSVRSQMHIDVFMRRPMVGRSMIFETRFCN